MAFFHLDRENIMSKTNNQPEPKFGYWFTPPESRHAPGGSRLDIFINEKPTEHHFDPEKLHLWVMSKENSTESLTIYHPWDFAPTYRALAGSIEAIDRYGKKEEAYTFGGSLKIESQKTFTVCTLESSAPILDISSADLISMLFIEEIEILLAERRAELLSKPHTYEKRLMNADPFTLYLACLNALIDKFEHSPRKEGLHINEFLNFLHVEGKRLKDEGLTPLYVSALEEVL